MTAHQAKFARKILHSMTARSTQHVERAQNQQNFAIGVLLQMNMASPIPSPVPNLVMNQSEDHTE